MQKKQKIDWKTPTMGSKFAEAKGKKEQTWYVTFDMGKEGNQASYFTTDNRMEAKNHFAQLAKQRKTVPSQLRVLGQ